MGKTLAKFPWLYAQGLTVLCLLIPVAAFLLAWVPSRQTFFTTRNFRALTVLGDQLTARIENAAKTLNGLAATAENTDAPDSVEQARSRIRDGLSLYPTLQSIGAATIISNSTTSVTNSVQLNVAQEVNTSWLTFKYSGAAGANTNVLVTIEARADFNSFIPPRSEFSGLLVAQTDGTVIFQRSQAGWKILKLGELKNKKGEKLEVILNGQISSMAEVTLGKTDYRIFLQPLAFSQVTIPGRTNQWWVCGLVQANHFTAECWAISHKFLVGFFFLVLGCTVSLPFLKVSLMGPRDEFGKGEVFSLGLGAFFAPALCALFLLHLYTYYNIEESLDGQLKQLSRNIQQNLGAELSRMHAQLINLRDSGRTNRGESLYDPNSDRLILTNVLGRSDLIQSSAAESYPFFQQAAWIDSKGEIRKKWTVRNISTPFINVKARAYFQDALGQRHSVCEWNAPHYPWPGNSFWVEPILSWTTGESSAVLSTLDEASHQVVILESKLLSVINPVVPDGYGYCVIAADGQVFFHSDPSRNLRENLLTECDRSPKLRSALVGGVGEPFDVGYRGKIHSFYVTPLPQSRWFVVVFRNEHILDSVIFDVFLISFLLFCFYALVLLMGWGLWLLYRGWRRLPPTTWCWPQKQRVTSWVLATVVNVVLSVGFLLVISNYLKAWQVSAAAAAIGPLSLALVLVFAGVRSASKSSHGKSNRAPLTDRDRCLYLLAVTSSLFVITVLPAYGFFKTAYEAQMKNFVEYGQLSITRQLQQRAERVENEYRAIGMASEPARKAFLDRRLALPGRYGADEPVLLDVYSRFFFDSYRDDEEPADKPAFESWLESLRPFHYRMSSEPYGLFQHNTANFANNSKDGRNGYINPVHIGSKKIPELRLPDLVGQWWQWVTLILFGAILCYIAHYIGRYAFLLYTDAEPGVESGGVVRSGKLVSNVLGLRFPGVRDEIQTSNVSSCFTRLDMRQAADLKILQDFSIGAKIPKTGLKQPAVAAKPAGEGTNGPRAVTGVTAETKDKSRETSLTIATPTAGVAAVASASKTESSTILIAKPTATDPSSDDEAATCDLCIDHFEYRAESPQFNDEKLRILEKLTQDPRISITLVSNIDPSNFQLVDSISNSPVEKKTPGEAQEDAVAKLQTLRKRWGDVLRSFSHAYAEGHRDSYSLSSAPVSVEVERGADDQTVEIIVDRISSAELQGISAAKMQSECRETRAGYGSVWAICSAEERVALYQVARSGFVHPSFPELPCLLARRLLVKDPRLRLMNEEFRSFVLSTFRPEELAACEAAEKGSAWNKLKGPAKTSLLILAVSLFFTQEELFDSVVKMMIAFTGSAPKLFDFLNMFKKGPSAK
jgi:hypothetical protein